MNPLDDLFREGLGDRRPEVPADLWGKIAARRGEVPDGASLDRLFASRLAERQAPVPAGMWERIVAARGGQRGRYVAAVLLLALFVMAGLTHWQGARTQVPADALLAGEQSRMPFPLPQPHPEDEAAAARSPYRGTSLPVGATDRTPGTSTAVRPAGTFTDVDVKPRVVTGPAARPEPTSAAVRPPVRAITVAVGQLPPARFPLTTGLSPSPPAAVPYDAGGFRSRSGLRPTLEVLLGAMYAHQRFTLQQDGERALRDSREVSEFPALSVQVSARAHFRLGGRWSLLTGVTYAELRNRLEYETLPAARAAQLMRTTNRLQLLEVPLLAGYRLSGGRLRLTLNAGPVLNAYARATGGYLDPDRPEPLDLADSGHYRRGAGIGWMASLTTTYPLGRATHTQLLLEPFYRVYPRSFTRPDAPLGERYWTAGLQLGLRRAF